MKQIQALQNQKTVLLLVGFLAMVLAIFCSDDPVIPFLRNTFFEKKLENSGWKNNIVFNLAVGYLVSLMFWFLVVHLPEKREKDVLKRNLTLRYRLFKQAALQTFSAAGEENLKSDDLARLGNYKKFQEFYRADGEDKWNKVLDGLVKHQEFFGELLLEMDLLATEIDYTLARLTVNNEKDLYVLRQFKVAAYRFKHIENTFEVSQKSLSNFVWSVFGYCDSVSGQRDYDYIQGAIDRL